MNNFKKTNVIIFKKLISFLKPHKFNICIIITALLITAFSILIFGHGLKLLIDQGFKEKNLLELKTIFLYLMLIIIILAVASFVRASFLNILCEKIEANIRKKLYNHVLYYNIEFFEKNKTSDIISRLTVDTAVLNSVIANLLSFVLRNSIMFFGAFIMMLYISVKLTAIILIIIPISVIPIILLSKKIKLLSKQVQSKIGFISAHIEESLNGMKTVKSFCNEQYESKKFNNLINNTFEISRTRYTYRAILSSTIISIALSSIVLVLYFGGKDVITQKISAGSLSSFLFYALIAATSLAGIGDVLGEIHKAASSAERIFEIFEIGESDLQIKNNQYHNFKNFNIDIQNISFKYPSRPEYLALDNLNLNISEGESVAIIGSSGSGKTTILNLLLNFYNNYEGKILIGDINIKDLTTRQLRGIIAIVPQDPIIFSATAFDNIKYGNVNATQEEIIDAAKKAEIFEFLNKLPQGFNSFLGEKGVRLSGGQKQRIAIARAILKKAEILLLDEATSALDYKNEQLVQKALQNLSTNKTTITIAHRISTIEKVDKIFVIENGKLVKSGKYNEISSYIT